MEFKIKFLQINKQGNAYLKKNNQKYKIPSDWNSSIMLSKKSSFLKQTLGPELHKAFIAIKGNGIS